MNNSPWDSYRHRNMFRKSRQERYIKIRRVFKRWLNKRARRRGEKEAKQEYEEMMGAP